MRIVIDRDSVAMGDDAESHRRELEFDSASTIGQLLTTIRPDASIKGGRATWLVILGTPAGAAPGSAVPVGVYAQEWAAARLFGPSDGQLGDLSGGGDVLTVYFRYLAQVDPAIAFNRYRTGGTMSTVERSQLSAQRIAQVDVAEARRDQGASNARYLSQTAVGALKEFGCVVRVHSARYFGCELQTHVNLMSTIVQANDTMAGVSINGRHLAYFRPLVHAEQFVVAQLGDAWRASTGRPPVALPDPAPGLAVSEIVLGRRWFVEYAEGATRRDTTRRSAPINSLPSSSQAMHRCLFRRSLRPTWRREPATYGCFGRPVSLSLYCRSLSLYCRSLSLYCHPVHRFTTAPTTTPPGGICSY